MDKVIRDLRREAPGRTRNKSASRSRPVAATTRRLEKNAFTASSPPVRSHTQEGLRIHRLSHDPQSPVPAGPVEEVDDDLREERHTFAPACLRILTFRGLERPIDEHG